MQRDSEWNLSRRQTHDFMGVPLAPKLLPPEQLTRSSSLDMGDDACINDAIIEECEVIRQDAQDVRINGLLLQRCKIQSCQMPRLSISNSRLNLCDLSNSIWEKAVIHRFEVLDSKLAGFIVMEGYLQNVLFRDCSCRMAQFRFSKFKNVKFDNCDFSDADFQGSDLSGVVFANCNLSRAEFSGTKLISTDFRGSIIDDLRVGISELKGSIMDVHQFISLSRLFGIVVK